MNYIRFFLRQLMVSVPSASALIMAMRGVTLATRFLLTMYIAKFMGLDALGEFGLIGGATAFIPSAISFGLVNRICRNAVTASREETTEAITQSWYFLGSLYLLIGVVTWTLAVANNQLQLSAEIYFMSLTEHLCGNAFELLVAVGKPVYANALMFGRLGLSTLIFMPAAFFISALNTIPSLITTLVVANFISMLFFAAATADWPWGRAVYPRRFSRLREGLRNSLLLYSVDVFTVGGQYLDRFLVSAYLGLELTGVYVLFWSVGNALCNLVGTGVLQLRRPLIVRAKKESLDQVVPLSIGLIKSTFFSSMLLGVLAAIALQILLPYLDKPLANSYLWVLWMILIGTVIRMNYEAIGVGLYSLQQDHFTLLSTMLVVVVISLLDLALIPYFKLAGAALAIILAFGLGSFHRWYLLQRSSASMLGKSLRASPLLSNE